MLFSTSALLQLAAVALAIRPSAASPAKGPPGPPSPPKGGPNKITNFIAFGDSYTDNCNTWRLTASAADAAKYPYPSCPPPPTGRASGGRAWPEYITRLGKVETLAFSAATCNNTATDRGVIKDVGEQIDLLRNRFNTTAPVRSLREIYNPATTIAAIYIGTNDLSYFLSDLSEADPNVKSNTPRNGNFLELSDCVLARLDELHSLGLKRFIILQNVPLQEFPLYGNAVGSKTFVETAVLTNNKLQGLMAQNIVSKWHDGSTIDIFPTYDLFESFFAHPTAYNFTTDAMYSTTSIEANNLHPSDRANMYLAKKMERFILENARGAQLINGTM